MAFDELDSLDPRIRPRYANPVPFGGIASPNIAGVNPPANLPGVTVPAPTPSAAPPQPSPTMVKPSIASPTQYDKDKAEGLRLTSTGSAIDQFSQKHHIAGPILRGLDIAGSLALPGAMSRIPGTTMHHNALVEQNTLAQKNDLGEQQAEANVAHTQAETKKLNNPAVEKPDNPEAAAYAVLTDPHSTPEEKQSALDALTKIHGVAAKPTTKNPEEQAFEEYIKQGKSPTEAFRLVKQDAAGAKPEKTAQAEQLRQRIAEAYEAGDPATVAKLQGELKAIGDPYAQQKIVIEQGRASDAHAAATTKQQEALDKKTKPLQQTIDEAESAHQLQKMAESGNAAADVDLALSFFKTMRGNGGAGIRFTQQEQNLIMGARNSAGDLQAMAQKVIGGGQKFTPQQRQQIVDVIDMHAKAAQSAMERMKNGEAQGADEGPVQEEYVRDPKTGKLVKK